jgi:hypothetical protein
MCNFRRAAPSRHRRRIFTQLWGIRMPMTPCRDDVTLARRPAAYARWSARWHNRLPGSKRAGSTHSDFIQPAFALTSIAGRLSSAQMKEVPMPRTNGATAAHLPTAGASSTSPTSLEVIGVVPLREFGNNDASRLPLIANVVGQAPLSATLQGRVQHALQQAVIGRPAVLDQHRSARRCHRLRRMPSADQPAPATAHTAQPARSHSWSSSQQCLLSNW